MQDDRGCGHSEDKFVADGAGLQVVRQRSYVDSIRSAVTHLLRGRRLSQWLILLRASNIGIRKAGSAALCPLGCRRGEMLTGGRG
jgi:hypothetical protein